MLDNSFKVSLDKFSGPLDLLLHLIRKKKMDIMDIKIAEITQDYLRALNNRGNLDPSIESDFLLMASTLIYIKSGKILPKMRDEEENPEKELIKKLIEYDKVQKISLYLKEQEEIFRNLFSRDTEDPKEVNFILEEIDFSLLGSIYFNLLKRKDKNEVFFIENKSVAIKKKINEINDLLKDRNFLDFTQYLEERESIEDCLISFFTVLELGKRGVISIIQRYNFDKIELWYKNAS